MAQGSEAGSPSIRQTNPGIDVTIVTANPASLSASKPELGRSAAQRIATPPPNASKSTTTVTPVDVGQGPSVQAAAARGAPALVPSARSSARIRAQVGRARAVSRPSSVSGPRRL